MTSTTSPTPTTGSKRSSDCEGGSGSAAILPPSSQSLSSLWGPFKRHGGWAPEAVFAGAAPLPRARPLGSDPDGHSVEGRERSSGTQPGRRGRCLPARGHRQRGGEARGATMVVSADLDRKCREVTVGSEARGATMVVSADLDRKCREVTVGSEARGATMVVSADLDRKCREVAVEKLLSHRVGRLLARFVWLPRKPLRRSPSSGETTCLPSCSPPP